MLLYPRSHSHQCLGCATFSLLWSIYSCRPGIHIFIKAPGPEVSPSDYLCLLPLPSVCISISMLFIRYSAVLTSGLCGTEVPVLQPDWVSFGGAEAWPGCSLKAVGCFTYHTYPTVLSHACFPVYFHISECLIEDQLFQWLGSWVNVPRYLPWQAIEHATTQVCHLWQHAGSDEYPEIVSCETGTWVKEILWVFGSIS